VNSHVLRVLFLAAAVVLVDLTPEGFHVLSVRLKMTKAGMAKHIAHALLRTGTSIIFESAGVLFMISPYRSYFQCLSKIEKRLNDYPQQVLTWG
jgi:hypothetical protein